jgi:hypothetical protein
MNKEIDYDKELEDASFTLDPKLYPLTEETKKVLYEMVQKFKKEKNLLKGEIV